MAMSPSHSSRLAALNDRPSLSADDRQVLTRIDLNGESQADLARELGVSHSGIKSRVQRARRRLRDVFEACCSVAQDVRGKPIDYQRQSDAGCACDAENSAC